MSRRLWVQRVSRHLAWACLVAASAACQAQPAAPEAAQLCLNCHRPSAGQAASPDAQLTPLLAGQQIGYLRAALQAYARRQRDHFFMRGIAAGLAEPALSEVLSYLAAAAPAASLPAADPPPAGAAPCMACHGGAGATPIAGDVPLLAGQQAGYLQAAFEAYAQGRRRHPVMQAQALADDGAMSLSPAELAALAAWWARQAGGLVRP